MTTRDHICAALFAAAVLFAVAYIATFVLARGMS